MAVLTNFLKLLKPEKNDYVDVDKHISENYDKIDSKMQELNASGTQMMDLLQNNSGLNFDKNLLFLNDKGVKTQGKIYFDRNKVGMFECIKTTPEDYVTNSTTYFVDISNKSSSDRLNNLVTRYQIGTSVGILYYLDFENLIFGFGYHAVKGDNWNAISVPKHSKLRYGGATHDGESGRIYSIKNLDENNIQIKINNGTGEIFGSYIFIILEK